MALDRQDFENLLGHGHLRSMIDYNMGIRVLQCVSIFKTLSSAEREKVFSALQRVSFKKGRTIVKQGDRNNTFFIIKDGTVKVAGGTLPTEELGAGEWFGDEELRSKRPSARSYTATVRFRAHDVQCRRLSHRFFGRHRRALIVSLSNARRL